MEAKALVTLLRAELVYGETTIVGHTTELTPERAFVRTDEMLDLGTPVELVLSFRGAVPPLHFRGVVTEHRAPAGPGEPAGLWLALEARSAQDLQRLRTVLEVSPSARQIRVLMVEDSSLIIDVFTHSVSRRRSTSRVRVDSAGDGGTAWAQLLTADYHLLIVDHFLPSSTGAELVAKVRSDARLRSLPIVGISIGGKLARDAMLAAGVDVFLEKPVGVRDLLATLDKLVGLGEEVSV